MKIEKDTLFGKVNIELPFKTGDRFYLNGSSYLYSITKIAIIGENIFLVDPNIWINIESISDVDIKKEGIFSIKTKN